jgi:hypothetical protein
MCIGGPSLNKGAEMNRKSTLKFGQKWPDYHSHPNNTYWIGADPMSSGIEHGDGLIVLGRDCSSLSDIESVAADIRADLDRVLDEARKKLGPKPK